jgi:O-antigen/teichoic acid export membrane protein
MVFITIQTVGFLFQVGSLVLVGRMLGASMQGQFAVIRAAVYLAEAVLWLGVSSSTTYFVARDRSRYLTPLLTIAVVHLAVAIAGIVLLISLLPSELAHSVRAVRAELMPFAVWLTCFALMQTAQRILLGLRRFLLYGVVGIVAGAVTCSVTLVMTELVGARSLAAATTPYIIGCAVATFTAVVCERSFTRRWSVPSRDVLRESYEVGIKGYTSSVAFIGLYRVDLLLMTRYIDPRLVGLYAMASAAAEAVQKVPDWLASVLSPIVASGRDPEGQVTRVRLLQALAATALLIAGVEAARLGGMSPLTTVFGADYNGTDGLFLLLAPKVLLHASMVIFAGYLAGRGYPLLHPAAGIAALATLVAVDLQLIPRWGLQGAVTGITLAYAVANVVMFVGYRSERRKLVGLGVATPIPAAS